MARLLAYLFEVTERFGMETRTELILLQRTMVVVEGVARSLDPNINIWQVAKPVVESYIKGSIGPAALLNDLSKAIRVLARFGPLLPSIAEAALIKQNSPSVPVTKTHRKENLAWVAIGGVLAAGVMWITKLL